MFWEVKQRLTLAARWRSDLQGNQNRTAETNKENFGAADWAEYCEKFVAYSLSAADKKLVAFEEMIKTQPSEEGTECEKGKGGSVEAETARANRVSIEERGIKLARELVRITTIHDPAAATSALQALVIEAQELLGMLGKAPEVTGKSIGPSKEQKKGTSGSTTSVLKGKDAA
jgi:hypothetical protein